MSAERPRAGLPTQRRANARRCGHPWHSGHDAHQVADPSKLPDELPAPHALFGFVGRSGAGKTPLITDVIDCLRIDGFTVSAIKRAHDGFDLDSR
jgi:Ni2+-binding GTPase involved in maturation of urease and hydrogenase